MRAFGQDDPRLKILQEAKKRIVTQKANEDEDQILAAKIDAYLDSYKIVTDEEFNEDNLLEEVDDKIAHYRANILDRIDKEIRNLQRKYDNYKRRLNKLRREKKYADHERQEKKIGSTMSDIQSSMNHISDDVEKLRELKEEVREKYCKPAL